MGTQDLAVSLAIAEVECLDFQAQAALAECLATLDFLVIAAIQDLAEFLVTLVLEYLVTQEVEFQAFLVFLDGLEFLDLAEYLVILEFQVIQDLVA